MTTEHFPVDVFFTFEFVISLLLFLALLQCPRRSKKNRNELKSQRQSVPNGASSCSMLSDATPRQAKESEKARLSEALHRLPKDAHLEDVTRIFSDMEERFPGLVSAHDYHFVVVRVSRGGDPGTAHDWLRRCIKVGIRPLPGTFNCVIHAYALERSFAEALGVAHEMQSVGVPLNTVTYNTIIDVWRRTRNADKAQLWMEKLLATGLQPNVISFGTVMLACADAGLSEELEKWFALSQKHKFQFDAKTLSPVVSALARRMDAESSMRWLRILVEHGVRPPMQCCAQVLTVIALSDDVEQAAALIDQMQAAGVQPDGGFMSKCVVMACSKGLSAQAQTWAEECVARNGVLTWTAKQAMKNARLPVPDSTIDKFEASGRMQRSPSKTVRPDDAGEVAERAPVNLDNFEDIAAARKAAVGKTYTGVVKDFVPGKFGYITCPAIFALFQKDVFLGRYSNPEQLTKGHRVSFALRVDERLGLPQASEVMAVEKEL